GVRCYCSVERRRAACLCAAPAGPVAARTRTKPASAAVRARRPIMSNPSWSAGSLLHGERAPEDEFLHTLSPVHLGGVDVPSGVHGEVVHPVELPRLPPARSEVREDSAALAQ